MRNLSDTIASLRSNQRRGYAAGPATPSRLSQFNEFGTNPGALRAYSYLPKNMPDHAPLVVVLHGCTQTAARYDHGAGWSQLADRRGFALLYPEQQRANNPNLCFNWFVPEDIRRESGEALSIAQMVKRMLEVHSLDSQRVFITGLSAGGAMTSVMLATYPELFASGAIIAGLPFACATTVPEAFERMRGHNLPSKRQLEAMVRGASSHQGPWPTLSVWHGTADVTVAPANMDAIVAQWRGLHGAQGVSPKENAFGGHVQRVWCNEAGVPKIEAFTIAGMGHGTPLDGSDEIGTPGAFMLDAGISSTHHIARFWTLTDSISEPSFSGPVERLTSAPMCEQAASTISAPELRVRDHTADVGKAIEHALRAAGLMR
ncbi:poly(hydroxyalkanoate) depolymerase family esterase [Bosea sp. OAE752]|uniref:extracellular catalytic domain type 1 short-chain-length polyhydroxyalkanoate depolymerase n=1 Tax=Bosea sp. OAE752 TaxID=2663873 RepID=UPI003D1C79A9